MSQMEDFVRRTRVSLSERGCVCDPKIEALPAEDGTLHVGVYHKSWCPLIRVLSERADGSEGSVGGAIASEALMADGSTVPWKDAGS